MSFHAPTERWVRGMGTCKLFDRSDNGVEIHQRHPKEFQNNSLVVIKLNSKFNNCTEIEVGEKMSSGNVNINSVNTFVRCHVSITDSFANYQSKWSNKSKPRLSREEFLSLPKLHIVMFVT